MGAAVDFLVNVQLEVLHAVDVDVDAAVLRGREREGVGLRVLVSVDVERSLASGRVDDLSRGTDGVACGIDGVLLLRRLGGVGDLGLRVSS